MHNIPEDLNNHEHYAKYLFTHERRTIVQDSVYVN